MRMELNTKIRQHRQPSPYPALYQRPVGSSLYLTMTQPDLSQAIEV